METYTKQYHESVKRGNEIVRTLKFKMLVSSTINPDMEFLLDADEEISSVWFNFKGCITQYSINERHWYLFDCRNKLVRLEIFDLDRIVGESTVTWGIFEVNLSKREIATESFF